MSRGHGEALVGLWACWLVMASVAMGAHGQEPPVDEVAEQGVPANEPTNEVGEQEVPANEVGEGHWLEVRGSLRDDGVFEGEEAELKKPERHELLIGTVTSFDRGRGTFELLGQPVSLSDETEFENLDARSLEGKRVEVDGEYGGPQDFEADEIEPQGEGSDRIAGRVDAVSETPEGVVVRIMRYDVRLPPTIEHEEPVASIPLAPASDAPMGGPVGMDEDDLFGRGIRLTDELSLAGQVSLEGSDEENYDLDDEDAEDILEQDAAARLRLQWRPSGVLHGVAEARANQRYRDDEEEGSSTVDQLRLGETYLFYRHPSAPFDVQVGRQDFDDEREWLYDRNLDGVRFMTGWFPWRLEVSASTTLSDGSRRDQDSTNFIAYLARERSERHLAFYAVHRRIDDDDPDRPTHVGFRLIGENEWIDLAWLTGESNGRDHGSWGLDVGRVFEPAFLGPAYVTVGYAYGSGDDADEDGDDRTFRQTGFQDNNGKFGGVTSFRYYGELVDPELSNLHVGTLGIGARVARRASLDLVGHYYRQDQASDELVESDLDEDPDGEHPELGFGVDLIYGDRRWESWDLEIAGSYFEPGEAYEDLDAALLGRVQVRFRF